MTEFMEIHPKNPQPRMQAEVARIIARGGVVVLPTDSGYSLCCGLGQKEALLRIRQIRNLDQNHYFTLFCSDFSEVSVYARLDNLAFRFLKAHTPAAVTFILKATREVPKQLLHPRRRTIGIRIPESRVVLGLLETLGQPLMSVSVEQTDSDLPPLDSHAIFNMYDGQIDAVIDDGGASSLLHTTIVDLTSGVPEVVRQGSYFV